MTTYIHNLKKLKTPDLNLKTPDLKLKTANLTDKTHQDQQMVLFFLIIN